MVFCYMMISASEGLYMVFQVQSVHQGLHEGLVRILKVRSATWQRETERERERKRDIYLNVCMCMYMDKTYIYLYVHMCLYIYTRRLYACVYDVDVYK